MSGVCTTVLSALIQANSLFGRELDLPTLGVDIPSAERLEKLIPKGGGGSGGGRKALKEKVEDAKTKARELAAKIKGRKKKSKDIVDADEKKKDDGEGNSSGDGDDVAEAADATPEAKEEKSDGEEASSTPGDDEKASPAPGDDVKVFPTPEDDEKPSSAPGDGEESSPLASSLRTPYFESTYVDEDLRVGRTGNGDVFVSIRA